MLVKQKESVKKFCEIYKTPLRMDHEVYDLLVDDPFPGNVGPGAEQTGVGELQHGGVP